MHAEDAWRRLRASRAHRPGLAATDDSRAEVYGAALEQAEQLWKASGSVGEVASPILLYYSFAQALRAWLEAAEADDPQGGHGLRLVAPTQPTTAGSPPLLRDLHVGGTRRGFAQSVARALHSPTFEADATASLDVLIASMPDAWNLTPGAPPPAEELSPPSALIATLPNVEATSVSMFPSLDSAVRLVTRIGPVPASVAPLAPGWRFDDVVTAWMEFYPTLSGEDAPEQAVVTPPNLTTGAPGSLVAVWPEEDGAEERFARLVTEEAEMEVIMRRSGWVLPAVAGNTRPQHPIVAWLATLFAMSMLARYQPAVWTRMLLPDEGRDAERIRHVLDRARDQTPVWVLRVVEQLSRP